MPKFHVSKSIVVKAKAEDVFKRINDFSQWGSWSPWLILEEEAKVDVRPDGKYYNWKGNRIGSGEMTVVSEKENSEMKADLTFLTPFKSHAKIAFYLTEEHGETTVNWQMDSSLPFFMFWMKKMMIALLGMDFDRGLRMLKALIEDGSVACDLTIEGKKAYPAQGYIGVKATCHTSKIGPSMQEAFHKLEDYFKSNELSPSGNPIAIYHKWDIVGEQTTYTTAFPVENIPQSLPNGLEAVNLPSMNAHQILHKGKYDFLGNAWSMQQMMMRNKEFKQNKKLAPFEVYLNDPTTTDPNELLTAIAFPMKS